MMASLVMATRGKPFFVWMGAAMAFLVHVVIATTIGVALFRVLPSRVLDAVVAVMFVVGGVYALREDTTDEEALIDRELASHTVVTTAFLVIFVAEWGDLTQILTANLAAHYHSGLSVGLGAVTALWAVAALAVLGGQGLLRYVNVATVRKITAGVSSCSPRSRCSRQSGDSPTATHPRRTTCWPWLRRLRPRRGADLRRPPGRATDAGRGTGRGAHHGPSARTRGSSPPAPRPTAPASPAPDRRAPLRG